MTDYRFSTLAYVLLSGEYGAFRVRDYQELHNVWDNHADRTTLATWADVAEVLADDDAELQIQVPVTSWGDYHGTDYDRANWNALQADFPGVFNVFDDRYGDRSLWIDAIAPQDDSTARTVTDPEWAKSLASGLAGLRDEYPLWSEEAHSAVEEELITEGWDSWMGSDVVAIIDKAADGTPAALYSDEINGQSVYGAFWTLYQDDESRRPYAESATSMVVPEWKETARDLAARFVAGWRPGAPLFPCLGCGVEMHNSRYVSSHMDCPQTSLAIAV